MPSPQYPESPSSHSPAFLWPSHHQLRLLLSLLSNWPPAFILFFFFFFWERSQKKFFLKSWFLTVDNWFKNVKYIVDQRKKSATTSRLHLPFLPWSCPHTVLVPTRPEASHTQSPEVTHAKSQHGLGIQAEWALHVLFHRGAFLDCLECSVSPLLANFYWTWKIQGSFVNSSSAE